MRKGQTEVSFPGCILYSPRNKVLMSANGEYFGLGEPISVIAFDALTWKITELAQFIPEVVSQKNGIIRGEGKMIGFSDAAKRRPYQIRRHAFKPWVQVRYELSDNGVALTLK